MTLARYASEECIGDRLSRPDLSNKAREGVHVALSASYTEQNL